MNIALHDVIIDAVQEVLAKVYRGEAVESTHFGSIAVVNPEGELLYYAGDPRLSTFTRSALKPFQATALIERGGLERFGFSQKGLAIMCGSHSGSEEHVGQVRENLEKINLDESFLQCGTHPPIDYRSFDILPRREETFIPVQHNCSGKHSGLLALALLLNEDPKRYPEFDSQVQHIIYELVSEVFDVPADQLIWAIDGCSIPNCAMTIDKFALGWARLASRTTDKPERKDAFEKVIAAMQAYPLMVSGERRSDYYLMQALPKEIVCKLGGEAIQGVALLDQGWGVAVKIADGGFRALAPVVVEVLRQLEVLPDDRLEHVERLIRPRIYNNRKLLVGHIEPAFRLKQA